MQTSIARPMAPSRGSNRPGARSVVRSIRYLARYKRAALLPYLFLIIATAAQLAVPNMIRRMIDAVTSGYVADQVLHALSQIPDSALGAALPRMLAGLGSPSTLTREQLTAQLNSNLTAAPKALLIAIGAVLVLAVLRGVFAFLQAFWAEKSSQAVAYDMRNDLYAKIQRL